MPSLLLNPTFLFIIFIVASVCVYLELAHPGAFVPGVIGVAAFALFIFGAASISPNWGGLALMLLSIVLLAVDVRTPTHGALTIGALISLVVGSLIFFNSAGNQAASFVNPIVIFSFAVGVGFVSLVVIRFAVASRHAHLKFGIDGLIGQTATVIEPLSPNGRVRVLGEDWAAVLSPLFTSSPIIPVQQPVCVVAREGLMLIVEPVAPLQR